MAIRRRPPQVSVEDQIKALLREQAEKALKEKAKEELARAAVEQFPETTGAIGEVVPSFLNPFSEAQAAQAAQATGTAGMPTVTVAADGATTGVAAPTGAIDPMTGLGVGLGAAVMNLGQSALEDKFNIANKDVKRSEGLGVGLGSSAVNAARVPQRVQAELLGKEDPTFLGTKAGVLAATPKFTAATAGALPGLSVLGPAGLVAGIIGGNLAKSVFGESRATKERKFRDSFRKSLKNQGLAFENEEGRTSLKLADGSLFSIQDEQIDPRTGKEIKIYRTDNFVPGDEKGFGGKDPLGAEIIGLSDVFSTALAGKYGGKKQGDITSMFMNAALSNAKGDRDVALANMVALGDQFGLSGDVLRARVDQLLADGKMEEDVAKALMGGIQTLEAAGLGRSQRQREQANAQRIQDMGSQENLDLVRRGIEARRQRG